MERWTCIPRDDFEEIDTEALTQEFIVIRTESKMLLQTGVDSGVRQIVHRNTVSLLVRHRSLDPLF
jgi:hypothetical protein